MQIDKKIYGFMYNRISKEIYDKPAVVNPDMVEGQFIMGTDSIPAMYQSISKHNLTGLYENIDQDVLLLAGEKDHYIPMCQFERCREKIKKAKSMTSRCFTIKEGGEQHCQIGNHSIAVDAILDWIERIS